MTRTRRGVEVLVKSGLPRADVELPDPRHRPDGGEPVPTGPQMGFQTKPFWDGAENRENRNSRVCDFKGPSCPGHRRIPSLPKAGLRLGLENVMERGDGR